MKYDVAKAYKRCGIQFIVLLCCLFSARSHHLHNVRCRLSERKLRLSADLASGPDFAGRRQTSDVVMDFRTRRSFSSKLQRHSSRCGVTLVTGKRGSAVICRTTSPTSAAHRITILTRTQISRPLVIQQTSPARHCTPT